MRLIDDREKLVGEKVEQGAGLGAGGPSGEVAGVVLDALAETHFLHHLDVVFGALLDALGFKVLLILFENLNRRINENN